MEDAYVGARDKPRALAKDAGVGLYTVQRILEGSSGANLDTIEAIGKVLQAEPYELLTPMYGKRRVTAGPEGSPRRRFVAVGGVRMK